MKKRIITLVSALLAVSVLLASYFLVTSLEGEDENETTAPPPSSYTVAEIDRATVYAFGYTYKDKSYDLVLKEDMTGWTLKSNAKLPISNVTVAYMIKHFELMTSDFRIESPSEQKLTEYGFDEPAAEIYFYDKNGRHGYEVGVLNTFNSMYYIRSTDAPDKIFLVQSDFMEYFTLDEMGLIQIYEMMSASLTKDITLEIINGTDKLVYKYYPGGKNGILSQSNSWFLSINGGTEFPINEKIAQLLSESCKYPGFAECVSYSEDDIKKYGLDDPVKISLKYTNVTSTVDSETGQTVTTDTPQSHTFIIGGKDNDGYSYAMTENEPLIYVTVSDVYSLLYDFDSNDIPSICTGFASNVSANDITSVKLNYNSKSYELKAVEGATGTDYYLNDKRISKDVATKAVNALSVVPWDNDKTKVSATTEEKTLLTVELSDGVSTHKYILCTYSEEFYTVKTDFCETLLVSANTVDSILSAVNDLTK